MNEIANSIERICKEYPKTWFSYELIWLTLCRCENASLGAEAAYEVLKQLPMEAKTNLGDALTSMIGDEPNALRDGFTHYNSVSGGRGILANAFMIERFTPPEWLKLVARLGQRQESSGVADGGRVIRGRTVVYESDGNKIEVRSGEIRTPGPW